jgi:hypothetical protein
MQEPAFDGGAGGSGIVIVKELNKASGSWPLRAQFSARKQGTWPDSLHLTVDYLVVAEEVEVDADTQVAEVEQEVIELHFQVEQN